MGSIAPSAERPHFGQQTGFDHRLGTLGDPLREPLATRIDR
jgi:hypothetical protein